MKLYNSVRIFSVCIVILTRRHNVINVLMWNLVCCLLSCLRSSVHRLLFSVSVWTCICWL